MSKQIRLCVLIFVAIIALKNQTALAIETNNQPLVHFKARFIKLTKSGVDFVLKSGNVVNTNGTITVEIITAEKLRPLLHGLYDNYPYLGLSEPEAATASGKVKEMCNEMLNETNYIVTVTPNLSSDGFTLNLKATVNKPEVFTAEANLWDGQTLAIVSSRLDGVNRLVVFVTARVIVEAEDSVHSDEVLHSEEELISREQKMKTPIPSQE